MVAVAVLVLGLSAFLPVPVVVTKPGEVLEAGSFIRLDNNGDGTELSGSYLVVTIAAKEVRLGELVGSFLQAPSERRPRSQFLPPGKDFHQYYQASRLLMEESQRQAIVAALDLLNRKAVYGGMGARVVASWTDRVPEDSLIVSIEHRDVRTAADLDHVLDTPAPVEGRTRQVRIGLRKPGGDEVEQVNVQAHRSPSGWSFPFLTVTEEPSLDTGAHVQLLGIDVGGTSAGLAMALEIVDRLDERDLAQKRKIAATGSIDANGQVDAVGGLRLKWFAARDAGADLFFVPEGEQDQLGGLRSTMKVIPVGSLQEAVENLSLTISD